MLICDRIILHLLLDISYPGIFGLFSIFSVTPQIIALNQLFMNIKFILNSKKLKEGYDMPSLVYYLITYITFQISVFMICVYDCSFLNNLLIKVQHLDVNFWRNHQMA